GGTAPSDGPSLASVSLSVSSRSAPVGSKVAVAIEASAPGSLHLAALQGELRFDAAKLKFIGQSAPAGKSIAAVNYQLAAGGRVPGGSLDPAGLAQQNAILAFPGLQAGYPNSLPHPFQTAGTREPPDPHPRTVASGVREGDVKLLGEFKSMGRPEWLAIYKPVAGKGLALVPGDLGVVGLKFGDVNLSGAVDINDALDIALFTVGLQELIIGTN